MAMIVVDLVADEDEAVVGKASAVGAHISSHNTDPVEVLPEATFEGCRNAQSEFVELDELDWYAFLSYS